MSHPSSRTGATVAGGGADGKGASFDSGERSGKGSVAAARDRYVIHAASGSRDSSHRCGGLTMVPTNPA